MQQQPPTGLPGAGAAGAGAGAGELEEDSYDPEGSGDPSVSALMDIAQNPNF